MIQHAEFVISNTKVSMCPKPDRPEYAFIGRSNVGKSSLINYITNNKGLAKTSGKPGKTQLINHFVINNQWYIVDLPGYGYAKTSKSNRNKWASFITEYILKRENLLNLFVLIDSRLPPQKIDMEFMEWLGIKKTPFSIVFTKTDKLTKVQLARNVRIYENKMLEYWESMPISFITSSQDKLGKENLLNYIAEINDTFSANNF